MSWMLLTVTGCNVWLHFLFRNVPTKLYKEMKSRIIAAGCSTSHTGLIVNDKTSNCCDEGKGVTLSSSLNSLRAVLIGAWPIHFNWCYWHKCTIIWLNVLRIIHWLSAVTILKRLSAAHVAESPSIADRRILGSYKILKLYQLWI